ncbi:hydroxysteroid dehydrogenase-like protein 1 [Uranotaenia lowii]|uniref:hydroxysteroid dehydrogenase-like protein 1 n=1 Tax=Uranotaenia lowii TaxID=190385 RepID=UPI0024785EBB|nr:hydroxysteroid dehydrogenase-like protein 1 [Uranotaenia lowii]
MVFWWIGVFATVHYLYNHIFESFFDIVWGTIREFFNPVPLPVKYGPWAVVTGATDGIGKDYAENLAQKGMNIVLISRTESKLIKVADEIRERYGVQTRWIAADFSQGSKVYPHIKEQLASLEIGMLVNNVGFLPTLGEFINNSEEELLKVVNINVMATTMMTRTVIPQMKQRRKGIVINIASSSGYVPAPYLGCYAASKAYIISLTLCLRRELADTGVEFQLVTPSIVKTNMSQDYASRSPWFFIVLESNRFVKSAIHTIGKTAHTCGHWLHCLQMCWWFVFPETFGVRVIGSVFKRALIR